MRNNGHEVGIAIPAGDQVQVHVAGQAGASASTEVQPCVKAVWLHHPLESLDTAIEDFYGFNAFLRGHGGEVRYMAIGGNHQMAVIIGITVENHAT